MRTDLISGGMRFHSSLVVGKVQYAFNVKNKGHTSVPQNGGAGHSLNISDELAKRFYNDLLFSYKAIHNKTDPFTFKAYNNHIKRLKADGAAHGVLLPLQLVHRLRLHNGQGFGRLRRTNGQKTLKMGQTQRLPTQQNGGLAAHRAHALGGDP